MAADDKNLVSPQPTDTIDADARKALGPLTQEEKSASAAAASLTKPPLKRKRWFDDWGDKIVFLGLFVFGFAAILIIKLSGGRAESAAIVAAILLVSYAVAGWTVPALRLQPDRLGDNCYYLGLLYTLASLSAALIQLQGVEPGSRGGVVDTLLASFGVALISTILGIALRVFFLQMRREVEDLEEELRRELQQRAMDLKDQMLFAVTELESFRLRTQQVLDERLTQSTDSFAANAKLQTERLAGLAADMIRRIDDSLKLYTEQANAITRTAQQVTEASAELAGKIQHIEVPADLITRSGNAMAAKLERATTKVTQAVEGLEQRLSQVVISEKALQSMAVCVRQVDDLERALPSTAAALDALRLALTEHAKALEELGTGSVDEARKIKIYREQIIEDLNRSRESIKKTQDGMTEVANAIVSRLGG